MPSQKNQLLQACRIAAAIGALSLAACSQLSLGTCTTTADCKSGAICDTTQSPPVCVVMAGACFPGCASNQTCSNGACVNTGCSPACTAMQLCDLDAGTCETVTQPVVTVTSPAANAYVGATLLATADAVAPTGVTALQFQVQRNNAAVAAGNGTAAPTAGDAANWAGSVNLSALASPTDGAAQLVAIATISGGSTKESPPVIVNVDLTPPAISMQTDGRSQTYAAGATVAIVANLSDSGAGFTANSAVKLAFVGVTHAPVLGTLTGSGATATANFSVVLDDTLAPPGASSSINFSITAMDAVGNSTTLTGDPKEVIRVNRSAPSLTIDANPQWHSQVDHVALTGLFAAPNGSLSGGSTAVVLSHDNTVLGNAIVTLSQGSTTNASWSFELDLSAQIFPANFAGAWAISAAGTDAAGNTTSATGSLMIDDDAPQISGVTVQTAPTNGASGTPIYGPGGNLLVTANIADSSGVAYADLAFQNQASVAGTSLDGGAWSFSVPRPSGSFDGTLIPFSISAGDQFADAGLAAQAAAVHTASASAAGLNFDNTPPAISVAANTNWYVRVLPDGGAALLAIGATISDGSGLVASGAGSPVLTPQGKSALPPSSSNGNNYSFTINPASSISANDAGPLSFTISASDIAGNTSSVSGTRNIDGAAPTLSDLQIFPVDGGPGSGSPTYPANVSGTGHSGSSYIYNDTFTLTGTVNEPGAGLQAVTLEVDGTLADGGVSPGQAIDLPCTEGASSCSINYSLAFNAAGNGSFNTPVDAGLPNGKMTIEVSATDLSLLPTGGAADQSSSSSTQVAMTRHLWHVTLSHLNNSTNSTTTAVTGFALHPDGDLIITGDTDGSSGANTINALSVAGTNTSGQLPVLDWSYGGNDGNGMATIGNCGDAPAIGAGDATGALIYIATSGGYLSALKPNGAFAWQVKENNTFFAATPTVVETSVTLGGNSTPVEEVIVPGDATTDTLYGVYLAPDAGTTATVNTAPLSGSATASPPLYMNSTLFLGTDAGTYSTYTLTSSGDFTDAGSFNEPTIADGYRETITDGTSIYVPAAAKDTTASAIYKVNPSDLLGAVTLGSFSGILDNPTLDVNGLVYLSTGDMLFDTIDSNSMSIATLRTLPALGRTALVGSNGHAYLPYLEGSMMAFAGGIPSWGFSRDKAISLTAAMDCNGTLYLGSGETIYAFVTDDQGLANSGWPNHRRDSRSTGNAGALPYGIRVNGQCAQ